MEALVYVFVIGPRHRHGWHGSVAANVDCLGGAFSYTSGVPTCRIEILSA